MTAAEITQYIIYGTVAFGAAVVLLFGFTTGLQVEPYIRKTGTALIPAVLIFGLGASTLFSTRDTNLYGIAGQLISQGQSSIETWILRLSTALAVGISTLVIAAAFLKKRKEVNAAKPLFIAFSIYFFTAYIANGIFGTDPTMSYKTFYPFVVVFALYMTSDNDGELMTRLTRDGLILLLFVGICLIFIRPDLVLQKNYRSVIPGLPGRFWGLSSHANNIAPLAIFTFLMICWVPYKSWIFNMFCVVICAITLLMAQSKTSYISFILIALIFLARKWYQAIFDKKSNSTTGLIAIGIAMLFISLALILFISDIYSRPIENLISNIQGRGTLLTGRENIWSITIAEWYKNPLFGYGPNLWGDEFSARFGYLGVASNAHNQFFDTLGSAGVIGISGLAIYLFILFKYSFMLANSSKWIAIAFVAFLSVRCISEVPLKTVNITTSDFIMHAIILGLFMRAAVRRESNLAPNTSSLNK
jgi:exopolysaccharide production protein ExoQ